MDSTRKKRRTSRSEAESKEEFFPTIPKIKYNPNAAADDLLCFRHYDADQVLMGKSMKEWLSFAVCYWHTFRASGLDIFGAPTQHRPWDEPRTLAGDKKESELDIALRRMRVAFEFFSKIGNPYWCFHDRDIAPEGETLADTNHNLDVVVALAKQLQKETGVKLLWGTANLFGHPKFAQGASTSPNAHVFACAAAQIKKAIEVTHELGGQGYVFWGGREGYQSLLNTDLKKATSHLATFLRMAVDYKQKIGFKGQFLIEPKAKEPTAHQYDYDAATCLGFLREHNLFEHFKLNIEPNHTTLAGHNYCHDLAMASMAGKLGSIDANTGDQSLGWDTDQFPLDPRNCLDLMTIVVQQGGLGLGGLNFDAHVRRESTDVMDLFVAHISGMDALAKGLKGAVSLINSKLISNALHARYLSFESGIGAKIESGQATLEDCEKFVTQEGNYPKLPSGKQEVFEAIVARFL